MNATMTVTTTQCSSARAPERVDRRGRRKNRSFSFVEQRYIHLGITDEVGCRDTRHIDTFSHSDLLPGVPSLHHWTLSSLRLKPNAVPDQVFLVHPPGGEGTHSKWTTGSHHPSQLNWRGILVSEPSHQEGEYLGGSFKTNKISGPLHPYLPLVTSVHPEVPIEMWLFRSKSPATPWGLQRQPLVLRRNHR